MLRDEHHFFRLEYGIFKISLCHDSDMKHSLRFQTDFKSNNLIYLKENCLYSY